MAKIAGVATKKNAKGEVTHVTVTVMQQKEKLLRMGLLEKIQFEKECEGAISVEETFNKVHEFINALPWKK